MLRFMIGAFVFSVGLIAVMLAAQQPGHSILRRINAEPWQAWAIAILFVLYGLRGLIFGGRDVFFPKSRRDRDGRDGDEEDDDENLPRWRRRYRRR